MNKLLLVSDAWHPQVNGVVTTLQITKEKLEDLGVEVYPLTPDGFRTVPLPTYPEIRLSITSPSTIRRKIEAFGPDYVHIATEGPLGMLARKWCLSAGHPYTTSYHTRFPEYIAARAPVPLNWSYSFVRRFHNAGAGCMVSNTTLEKDLSDRGFTNLYRWVRGVDQTLFRTEVPPALDLPGPVFMYVGRVSVEKNIEAFLKLDLPGTKVVVGTGPSLESMKSRYPDTVFTGPKFGDDLVAHYRSADVFVFPSLTDTWGLVLLEAMACGVPVAAFPIMGPIDVVADSGCGALDTDLKKAALAALDIPGDRCRAYAETFSWEASAQQFLENVQAANEAALSGQLNSANAA
ncbi:glycosyltransferase family 4 protein [Amorphus orientalis]|uniref:Glycosyltransferase involved in cell wall biosynthesis n=1 Tax=Amorphus orientalis TaxID=649198 RepID=A0AAE3VS23_9HYPH|nr:glycosyltransferase family 1 protein [Amorphus orientalis]MDQ0317137.1 glycosyltransferase involved in cell wall biosynthesis [Amorphus orientalis]